MKNTSKISSIALILMLTLSATILALPLVTAHDPAWTIPTYAYVATIPSTQQVNNWVQVVMWLNTIVPTAAGVGGDRFEGFMLNITAPDGTMQQLGPFDSDQVGTKFIQFTPNQVGDYTLQFYWPGQTLTTGTGVPYSGGLAYVGDFFEGAVSDPITLTVQQDPIETWQSAPTPTDYWQRPINALNRDTWGKLASNWLYGNWLKYNFQTAGQAPNSAHILWQTPIPGAAGGILDAQWWTINTNVRDYETPFFTSYGSVYSGAVIIMDGVLYFPTPQIASSPKYGYYALDLYTGNQLWFNNGSSIPATPSLRTGPGGSYLSAGGGGAAIAPALTVTYPQLAFGQLYQYYSVNGRGVLPYLWATGPASTWYMLDPKTGNWILTIKNVPSGTATVDQDGSLLIYSYNPATGNLLCWNSSQSIPPAGPVGTAQQQWRPPVGATIDALNDSSWTTYPIPYDYTAMFLGGGGPPQLGWSDNQVRPRSGYTMNVTMQPGLSGISAVLLDDNRVPQQIFGWSNPGAGFGLVTGGNGITTAWCAQINRDAVPPSPYSNETYTQNNNLGYTVSLLWQKTYDPPVTTGNITYELGPVNYDAQVFTVWAKETRQWYGYSLKDGSLLWGPTEKEAAFNMYNAIARMDAGGASTAYGNLYSGGYGGTLYCYNISTGELSWSYTATGIATESPYGSYPLNIGAIADGKVFVYTDLGYVQQPLWRGAALRAVDAYTGKEVWKMLNWVIGGMAVADGYLVAADQYNNMINCFGKGPSKTTVTGPEAGQSLGKKILIKGTVTDESPGTKSTLLTSRFPNGVPAVTEDSMQAWMEYLYEQQSCPENAEGVEVVITTFDPNGNTYELGRTTSSLSGTFGCEVDPPVPGLYKIIATFEGSASYYGSYAETYLIVEKPSTAAQQIEPEPPATQPHRIHP